MQTAAETLRKIDKRIDSVHREMERREGKLTTCGGWQHGWDRHGDLRRRNRKLYDRRWEAQQKRDDEAAREAKKAERAERKRLKAEARAEVDELQFFEMVLQKHISIGRNSETLQKVRAAIHELAREA